MTEITDGYMQDMLSKTKEYSFAMLKPGPNAGAENVRSMIWEHARRNFSLRANGIFLYEIYPYRSFPDDHLS